MKIPVDILALVEALVPRLLIGDHPAAGALRAQYARATVVSVDLTGVGLFASFTHAEGAARVEPANLTGGNAVVDLAGLANGAGCLLFVREGRLESLEVYTFGEPWPDVVTVLGIRDVTPLLPSSTRGA